MIPSIIGFAFLTFITICAVVGFTISLHVRSSLKELTERHASLRSRFDELNLPDWEWINDLMGSGHTRRNLVGKRDLLPIEDKLRLILRYLNVSYQPQGNTPHEARLVSDDLGALYHAAAKGAPSTVHLHNANPPCGNSVCPLSNTGAVKSSMKTKRGDK